MTLIAKPLPITIAALSTSVVNRNLGVCLTCIIIFAFLSALISRVVGQEQSVQELFHRLPVWRLEPEPGSANAPKKRSKQSDQNEHQPSESVTVYPVVSMRIC